jgi:gentisate 1,2-dioxygenase
MLELSDIQSSQEELQDYYAQLAAQHVTPAWIGGGISIEPRSEAVTYLWHWRDLRRRPCGRPSWSVPSRPNAGFCA